jgi:hypothetical protein
MLLRTAGGKLSKYFCALTHEDPPRLTQIIRINCEETLPECIISFPILQPDAIGLRAVEMMRADFGVRTPTHYTEDPNLFSELDCNLVGL